MLKLNVALEDLLEEHKQESAFPGPAAAEFKDTAFKMAHVSNIIASHFHSEEDTPWICHVTAKLYMVLRSALLAHCINPRLVWDFVSEDFMGVARQLAVNSVKGSMLLQRSWSTRYRPPSAVTGSWPVRKNHRVCAAHYMCACNLKCCAACVFLQGACLLVVLIWLLAELYSEMTWLFVELAWIFADMTWLLAELYSEMTWLLVELAWIFADMTWLLAELYSEMTWLLVELAWLFADMIWLFAALYSEMTWFFVELAWLFADMIWLLAELYSEMTWFFVELAWLFADMIWLLAELYSEMTWFFVEFAWLFASVKVNSMLLNSNSRLGMQDSKCQFQGVNIQLYGVFLCFCKQFLG